MAKLIVNPTSASRREIQLSRMALSIGRDPSNDLVLADAMVSRRHAVVEPRGEDYFLRDCNSSNGSLVNGDRVSECSLKDGDLLAIGATRLLFREEAVSAEEAGAKVVQHPSAPKLECPSCQADYRVGDRFCRTCGAQIGPAVSPKMLCPSCGTVVTLPARFCNVCGTELPQASPALETTKAQEVLGEEGAGASATGASVPATGTGGAALGWSGEVAPAPASPPPVAPPAISRRVPPAPPQPLSERSLAPTPRVEPPRPRSLELRPGRPRTEPAGAGARLAAALIDTALVTLLQFVLMIPVLYYWWSREWPVGSREVPYVSIGVSLAVLGLTLILGALYYVYYWGVSGATPGKRVLGLAVADLDGRVPIGFGPACLRLLGYALSGALLGVGFLMVPLSGRGLHDRMAGTQVIRRDRG